ncbi:3-oxoacyl-[acyl-carrier-protein] synthase, mitochondrial-like [Ornithodoros turicata]|uniref:3-oxoacyl-[acyl-carrier-protein] synthase, mitochondrial-like n=1 Tax=Ornithodoros turicata TaxID=34597 RepID=UPI003139C1E9
MVLQRHLFLRALDRVSHSSTRSLASIEPTHRRVVVTGIGMVTPLGVGTKHVWNQLIKCQSGITLLSDDFKGIPASVAGIVPRDPDKHPASFSAEKYLSKSDLRTIPTATAFAIAAADEALDDAAWHPQADEDRNATGVAIGMAMSDLEYIVDTGVAFRERGYNRVSPLFVPKILTNMASGHVSIRHNLRGPNHSVATACTTGLHAVGDSFNFVQHGFADVMVCGGTEASISPLSVAAFARMRALSTAEDPSRASRPFDKGRDGFVIAEGAVVLVLEELHHALRRKANIYGEILGYGLSADAVHITASSTKGDGAFRCMRAALRSCGTDPKEVGHINAHATSTPIGDAAEAAAIQQLFGDNVGNVAVTATKSATGHLLGAAGAIEAAFTVLACRDGIIPPILNLEEPDVDAQLDFVVKEARIWADRKRRRVAVKNSFGFGGTNASLVIAEFKDNLI